MLQVAHIINDNLQQFAYCLAAPAVTLKSKPWIRIIQS